MLLLFAGYAFPGTEAGQQLFVTNCAACHGLDGRGGEHAPNIATDGKVQQLSNARLLTIVKNGIASAGMPAFGSSLNSTQLSAIVSYLRVLQGTGIVSNVPGNPAEGKALFFGKAQCSRCHMIDGKGGFIGSDLSGYGSTHTPRQIRDAILTPNKDLEPKNRTVVVTARDGGIYRGIARNEDNFSLQLQTQDGDFHLFDKADVRHIEREAQSLMPRDYRKKLTSDELNDLVSYLSKTGNTDPGPISDGSDQKPRSFQLVAISSKFWNFFDHNARLTKMAAGFGFTEGPVWDPAGFLYVSDEVQNKIYRVHLDGAKETVLAIKDPDGNTYDRQHRLLDCASIIHAIIQVNPNGRYRVLSDQFEGKRFNSPNDIVTGPDGALYFTDPTLDLPKGVKQEIPFQGVYRLDAKGNVRLLVKDMSQPNGIAFSPDGKRMYVDDSDRKDIRVFDFQPDGTVAHERVFGEEKEPGGVPDGMRVDRNGNLFVVGPRGIWVWDPDGNHLGTIVLPEQPANLAWGDKDYKTLYITATTSIYRIRTKARGFVP